MKPLSFPQLANLTEDQAREHLESIRWVNGIDLPQLFGPLFKLVNSSIYSLLYYPLALRPHPVV